MAEPVMRTMVRYVWPDVNGRKIEFMRVYRDTENTLHVDIPPETYAAADMFWQLVTRISDRYGGKLTVLDNSPGNSVPEHPQPG